MPRLTREESQAQTRSRLLASALKLFARDGYRCTAIDKIAEDAGYSKGAFYSNFAGKEQIYLEVLSTYGECSLQDALTRLAGTESGPPSPEQTISLVADWADHTARSGNWAQLILEFSRGVSASLDPASRAAQETLFRSHWRQLGERVCTLLTLEGVKAETLGALLYELTYAPAMSFVTNPGAGDLIRLALGGLYATYGRISVPTPCTDG